MVPTKGSFTKIRYTPPGNKTPRTFGISRCSEGLRDFKLVNTGERPTLPLKPLHFNEENNNFPDIIPIMQTLKKQENSNGGPLIGMKVSAYDLKGIQFKTVKINEKRFNGASCIGYMLCFLDYDDGEFTTQDFIISSATNIVPKGGGYRLHKGEDVKNSQAGGQSHVEQICGAQLNEFLKLLKTIDGKPQGLVPDKKKKCTLSTQKNYKPTRKFLLKNLNIYAKVVFQGSQTSACVPCVNYWKQLDNTWGSQLKSFDATLTK